MPHLMPATILIRSCWSAAKTAATIPTKVLSLMVACCFFNPAVPYCFERLDIESTGFFCLFKKSPFIQSLRNGVHDLRIFEPGDKPVYNLTESQDQQIAALFEKITNEFRSDYRFRFDLVQRHFGEEYPAIRIPPATELASIIANFSFLTITKLFSNYLKRSKNRSSVR